LRRKVFKKAIKLLDEECPDKYCERCNLVKNERY